MSLHKLTSHFARTSKSLRSTYSRSSSTLPLSYSTRSPYVSPSNPHRNCYQQHYQPSNEYSTSLDPSSNDAIDWSTRELTQAWFNERASGFPIAVESNAKYVDMLTVYDDNVIDINWWGCFSGKPDLLESLERDLPTNSLSSWNAYLDVETWSKQQVIVKVVYIFKALADESINEATRQFFDRLKEYINKAKLKDI
eukprot:598023_1